MLTLFQSQDTMPPFCKRAAGALDADNATKLTRCHESGSRIPASLQAIFVASSLGKEVSLTPSDGSASRVFLQRVVLGRKTASAALASSRKSSESGADPSSFSTTDSSASNHSSSDPRTLEATCRDDTHKRVLDESSSIGYKAGALSMHRCKDDLVTPGQSTSGDREYAINGANKHGVSALSPSSHCGHRRITSCCSTVSSGESSTTSTVKELTTAKIMVHVILGEKGGGEQSPALPAIVR